MATVDPKRTTTELKELRTLTGDDNGAQRVAFTDTWVKARDCFKRKLEGLPVTTHQDEAGNLWVTLEGASERELWIGGHLDSVPNGGWLDGCLNVFAGLEVLRRISDQYNGKPPVTVKLVDWCDEEGARFGRSLFGSSAVSGFFDPNDLRDRKDKDGVRLEDAVKAHGIDLDRALEAGNARQNAAAYLELHIEQGPVLEALQLPLGVVMGTKGVERHAITFHGQEAHSGATPMTQRRDALGAAAKLSLEIREIAKQHKDAVCTVGSVKTFPGIVTAVVGCCEMTLDQRDLDAGILQSMYDEARAASEKFAKEEGCTVSWSKIWNIEPIPFHPQLIQFCDAAILETVGTSHRLPSGPLHDAAEVSRVGIPTVMMFVQSSPGISHNKLEDTPEQHLESCVVAFDRLAQKTLEWVAKG
ncbi:MAG: Zn-dependent hydrolase [Pleurocapsa sp. SU_196_0]|nr:Zn-dependent hydrolase [Pleurocapsa sp. SU_196_0]